MFTRSQIIKDIIESFYNAQFVFHDDVRFEFEDPELLKKLVTLFVIQKCENMNNDEIMNAFSDKGKILDEWIVFLKAKRELCGKTVN